MGRKQNRQQEKAAKLALAAATLGIAKVMIELLILIIEWLTR